MLKNLLNLTLGTTLILGSLSTLSYAQKPISAKVKVEDTISPTQIKLELNAPSIITEGFEAYCSEEHKNPVTIWSQNMTPLMSAASQNEASEVLMNFTNNLFGECIGYSIIGSHSFTEKTQFVYIESDHENTPLFWKFIVYASPKGLIIYDYMFNTKASEVIPPSILMGE